MKVTVLLFAGAREAVSSESVQIDVKDPARAADILAALGEQQPQLAPLLPSCRLAIDCQYVGPDEPVSSASEIALIPPVSGG